MDNDAAQQAEFVSLIARHQALLHSFIISLMPGVDGVDDVLQETNIVLWEKRRSFESGSNFQAWAFQIARFKVMNHRRKMASLGQQTLDDEVLELLSEEQEIHSEELDRRLQALKHCLQKLPDKQRQLIERRYLSGKPLKDFATECGRTAESVGVSLFRIRSALKKCIRGELQFLRSPS